MSENEFELIKGNSYRGSRYSNFVGAGIDPVGNVSSAVTENNANAVGTSVDRSEQARADAPPTPTSASQGLTAFDAPSTSDLVIGGALPYAGNAIGQAAGSAIAGGASISEGLSTGVSSLANKVSGGLLGTAASPTNLAIQQSLGGAAGPATKGAVNAASKASNVGQLGSGANLGAAAGSGIATAAATLIATGDVKEAAKAGVATAIGTAIGNAILPGIGGFVGGFIGGLFCFGQDVPILMADGSRKMVQDIKIGDITLHGGMVIAAGQALADDLYEYKNTVVTSYHAVFEDGKWIRAEDSEHASPIKLDDYATVYPLATKEHIIVNPWYISADLLELDENVAEGKTSAEIIDTLNSYTDRNEFLLKIEEGLSNGKP